MTDRVFGEFVVYAGALQSGGDAAVAHVITKPVKGDGRARIFNVISSRPFRTAEEAMRAAHVVVAAVETVSADGVPHPLTFAG